MSTCTSSPVSSKKNPTRITTDSAGAIPAHAAAALNCPLVVLFGKANPARFRPLSDHGAVQVIQGFAGGAGEGSPDIGYITVSDAFDGWCDASGLNRGR